MQRAAGLALALASWGTEEAGGGIKARSGQRPLESSPLQLPFPPPAGLQPFPLPLSFWNRNLQGLPSLQPPARAD